MHWPITRTSIINANTDERSDLRASSNHGDRKSSTNRQCVEDVQSTTKVFHNSINDSTTATNQILRDRPSRLTTEHYKAILRVMVAAKAQITPQGRTRKPLEVVVAIINGTKAVPRVVSWRIVKVRYHRLQNRPADAQDRERT